MLPGHKLEDFSPKKNLSSRELHGLVRGIQLFSCSEIPGESRGCTASGELSGGWLETVTLPKAGDVTEVPPDSSRNETLQSN